MAYLLFFIYLLALSWLVTKINYSKASGLSAKWLAGLFVAKVACGVLYGFIYSSHPDTADTWQIYNFSLDEYNVLLTHPARFLQTWGPDIYLNNSFKGAISYIDLFGNDSSYWNMLKDIVLIKIEALLNVFSNGNYYVNIVLYAFLTFGGYIAFYRGLLLLYPGSVLTSLLAVFFIPSCFFWTSGMYKDGVLFMLLGYIVYQMALLVKKDHRPIISFIKISVCLLFIFVLRNYIAFIMIPALAAWWLAVKYPAKAAIWFAGIFCIGSILFFLIPYIYPAFNLPALLASKRQEFILLPANSALLAYPLEPTLKGFIHNLPEALNYGFLRPYIWENKGLFYVPFAIELLVIYGIGLYYFIKKHKNVNKTQHVFFLFAIVFLAVNWILLGYTAPIIGALIRYKSLFTPFIMAHILYFTLPQLNILKK